MQVRDCGSVWQNLMIPFELGDADDAPTSRSAGIVRIFTPFRTGNKEVR